MKPTALRLALLLSVAVNLGVLGAIALDRHGPAEPAAIAPVHETLQLDAAQRTAWEAAERPFLEQFGAAARQLDTHRAALIRALFADPLDMARVEAERGAIATLQQQQQGLLIDQLLAERKILSLEQQARLAEILLSQTPPPSQIEHLHGR